MINEKKCRRCKDYKPMSKFKYNPTLARRRERVCEDCVIEMKSNPSKYIPTSKRLDLIKNKAANPSGYRSKPKVKVITDIERIKAIQKIMAVGIDPRKTQIYYMRREVPLETKQVRLR